MTQTYLSEDEWWALSWMPSESVWDVDGPFKSRIEAEKEADIWMNLGFETRVVHSVFTS